MLKQLFYNTIQQYNITLLIPIQGNYIVQTLNTFIAQSSIINTSQAPIKYILGFQYLDFKAKLCDVLILIQLDLLIYVIYFAHLGIKGEITEIRLTCCIQMKCRKPRDQACVPDHNISLFQFPYILNYTELITMCWKIMTVKF